MADIAHPEHIEATHVPVNSYRVGAKSFDIRLVVTPREAEVIRQALRIAVEDSSIAEWAAPTAIEALIKKIEQARRAAGW